MAMRTGKKLILCVLQKGSFVMLDNLIRGIATPADTASPPAQSGISARGAPGNMSANNRQVSGTHYKCHTIQPWDAILDWGLGFLDGNIVKYVARWQSKDGLTDLKKARHYLDKLIEVEEAKIPVLTEKA